MRTFIRFFSPKSIVDPIDEFFDFSKVLREDHHLYFVNAALKVPSSEVHLPLVPEVTPPAIVPIVASGDIDGFQAALIALAAIIIVLGIAGIIYVCRSWKK